MKERKRAKLEVHKGALSKLIKSFMLVGNSDLTKRANPAKNV